MTTMQALRNSVFGGFARVFPSFFGLTEKHDHYSDYGWPKNLEFDHYYRMYSRNGLATAGVDKTIAKTWESLPELWESEDPAESQIEADIRQRFSKLRFWHKLMTADRRGMVGEYSGVILVTGS